MVSVKNLSLGKNEDPKKRGSRAKQVSLDGTTVVPAVGRTRIEQPKVENVRWFGTTGVNTAAVSQIPTLEMPSVRGVIENATPKDSGRYAEALTNFAQQIAQGGKSLATVQKLNQEENYTQAKNLLETIQFDNNPVRNLSKFIGSIEKKINKLSEVKYDKDNNVIPKTEDQIQHINDLKKHITDINSKRGLQSALKSVLREEQVINNALSWNVAKKTILVPNTNDYGGITDNEGELSEISVSDLPPTDPRYIDAFKKHVYGDFNLSAFELKNIEGRITSIRTNDITSQNSKYQTYQKNNIASASYKTLEINLDNLIKNNKDVSIANVVQNLNENLEFIKNSHLYDKEEQNQIVGNMIGMIVEKFSNSQLDVDEFLNTMFYGDKEKNIQPLMVGPIDNRYRKDATLNDNLFLVNQLGGKVFLTALITDAKAKQEENANKRIKGQGYIYENEFDAKTLDSTVEVNGKQMNLSKAIILGDTDQQFGNTYVSLALNKLEETKQNLITDLDPEDDNYNENLILINKTFTERKNKVLFNLLSSDYQGEVRDLNNLIFKVSMSPNDLKLQSELGLKLTMFESSYQGIPKADEMLADIKESLIKINTTGNAQVIKSKVELVKDYHDQYAKTQTDVLDYNSDIVWAENEQEILRQVNKIIDEAKEAFPNNLQDQENYINQTIEDRWKRGAFIPDRTTNLRGKVHDGYKGMTTAKEYNNKLKSTFKNVDRNGILSGVEKNAFIGMVNSGQPMITKRALIQISSLFIKGEKLPKGLQLLEKNLRNTSTPDMASFIISQYEKLGIPLKKSDIGVLEDLIGKSEQERKDLFNSLN
tara:strand:+ start:10061 stop:12526 length:2466 start_codon:yes stop_codon:yes gene_type:complete